MPDPVLERIIADLQRRREELERWWREQQERERSGAINNGETRTSDQESTDPRH